MDLVAPLLDSWDRQCTIVRNVASLVDEGNRTAKPSPDGKDLADQLAHIHLVRCGWLHNVMPEKAAALGPDFAPWNGPVPDSLDERRARLDASEKAIRDFLAEQLPIGAPVGGYDHPVLFLQHMVWHEGWHIGLMFLALRLNGQEPPEEWEEPNVWGLWRVEEWE